MAEVIDLTVSAKVKNGPTISFFNSLGIDAYDKLNVLVTTGATKTIQLVRGYSVYSGKDMAACKTSST